MTPKEVLQRCKDKGIKAVDLRFMDFPGLWQHFTIPASRLEEDTFESGLGFDGALAFGFECLELVFQLLVFAGEVVEAGFDGGGDGVVGGVDAVDELQGLEFGFDGHGGGG